MAKRIQKDTFRDQLLAQEMSSNKLYKKYRGEDEKMIDKESKALRRQKWITLAVWIFIVLLCTAFLLIGGYSKDPTMKLWFGILACFCFMFGTVYLFGYFINRSRVELLKEMKEIQLRIFELYDKIDNKT